MARCDSIIGTNAVFCCETFGWDLFHFARGLEDFSNRYFVESFRKQVTDTEKRIVLSLFEMIAIKEGFSH